MTIRNDEIHKQIKDSLEVLKSTLGHDLLGVYLFGSAAFGELQKYSDLDLFVVTNRPTTADEKTKLISHFLQISGIYMKSSRPPIEMTLVEALICAAKSHHREQSEGRWGCANARPVPEDAI